MLLGASQPGLGLTNGLVGLVERLPLLSALLLRSVESRQLAAELLAKHVEPFFILGPGAYAWLGDALRGCALVFGEASQRTIEADYLGLDDGPLLTDAGDALAHHGQAALADSGLLAERLGARSQLGESLLQ